MSLQASGAPSHCLFILEKVLKLSVSAKCSACEQPLKNQICSFVGCHVGANVQAIYVTRATLKVEDGTGSAILVCDNSRHVQSILHISADEWKDDIEKEAKSFGELLYLSSSAAAKDLSTPVFQDFCRWYPQHVLCQFHCLCRLFKNSLDEEVPKFYCLDVLST